MVTLAAPDGFYSLEPVGHQGSHGFVAEGFAREIIQFAAATDGYCLSQPLYVY